MFLLISVQILPMLAAQQLIDSSKPERVLPGHLFPLNNNRGLLDLEDVYATTVLASSANDAKCDEEFDSSPDSDHIRLTTAPADIVGFGLFHKCAPNQIYCSLVSVSKQFEQLFVNVERVAVPKKMNPETKNAEAGGRHILLRLTDVRHSLPDLSTLPQYFTAFADPIARPLLQCIVDEFARVHIGIREMETRHNFTVDLYDSNSGIDELPDNQWRDFAGFIVADRFRYCQIELESHALLSSLADISADGVHRPFTLQPLSTSNRTLFHHYDQTVSIMGREEYLDFLLNLTGVEGIIAIDQQQMQPIGYALAYNGCVLQCYADEEKVAAALLSAACRALRCPASLSLFLRLSHDDLPLLSARLIGAASRIRRVRRFHSRSMPETVKWAKVVAPGIGLHLF